MEFKNARINSWTLLLLSASWVQAQMSLTPSQSPSPHLVAVLPFQVTVVETEATREFNDISNKTITHLAAKDYGHLDDLANTLRTSKKTWANGSWKLFSFYSVLLPAKKAPEPDWQERLTSLRDWVGAKPKSATARTALANFLVDYGWHARGGGWASTVTDEGWRLFDERLKEAVRTLKRSEELGLTCPVSWSVLLLAGVGLGVERPDFDAVFEKATRFAPDYKGYYYRRAMYLLPRWHGEPGEWERDLAKSADRVGGAKGDELYAQIVWCMHSINFTNIFKENELSWERVDRGFGMIEKDFPDSLAARNERAHLAVLARDYTKACKYFEETEGKVDLSVWKSTTEYVRFANSAFTHSKEVGLNR